MSSKQSPRGPGRSFRAVDTPEGVRYEPKGPVLRKLGKPPWTVEVEMFDGLLPDEAVDLVDTIVWRGVEFKRADADN